MAEPYRTLHRTENLKIVPNLLLKIPEINYKEKKKNFCHYQFHNFIVEKVYGTKYSLKYGVRFAFRYEGRSEYGRGAL